MSGPSYVLLVGFPKCGTSSLFYYLQQHPGIAPSGVKETHLLYPDIRSGALSSSTVQTLDEQFRDRAAAWRLEGSPGTVVAPRRVVEELDARLGGPRVIALVRDPVARFWSAFRFMKSRLYLEGDVGAEAFLERNLAAARRGRRVTPPVNEDPEVQWLVGCYARFVEPWLEVCGERLLLIETARLSDDPAAVVDGTLSWLGLPPLGDDLDTTRQNVTRAAGNRSLQRLAWQVNDRLARFWRRFPRLEDRLRRVYHRLNGRPLEDPPEHVTARLTSSYAAEQAALAALLRDVRGTIGFGRLRREHAPGD